MRVPVLLVCCVCLSCFFACKNKTALGPLELNRIPPGLNLVEVNFSDSIQLVGYELESCRFNPGQKVRLTLYWRCQQKLNQSDWQQFTHLLYANSGRMVLNLDQAGELRMDRRLRPSRWKEGVIYADPLQFHLPQSLAESQLNLVTGFYRSQMRMPVIGAVDRPRYTLVTRLDVELANKHGFIPTVSVPYLTQPIVIDGKLKEKVWRQAAQLGPFVNVSNGRYDSASPVQGEAMLFWDSHALYVAFVVKDRDVVGTFDGKAKDPPLWTQDTVEIMLDPDGDGDNRDYYEIQVNPQNLVFDSQFDTYNRPRDGPKGPFGHQVWSVELKSAVAVQGSLNQPNDQDQGYVVEMRIPFSSFTKAKRIPPRSGDAWRANFYAMQNNAGVAWSPILGQGNFHKASRFGKLIWHRQQEAD